MKHLMNGAVLSLFLLTACCREPDPPEPDPEPEPPIVRNDQMYALIDGEEWRSCGPITAPKTGAQNFIGSYLDISGLNLCRGGTEIYLKILDFYGEGTYTLGGNTENLVTYRGNQTYSTGPDYVGVLEITQVDSTDLQDGNRLPSEISGSFSFTALGEDSTTVIIVTEGQFVKLDVYNF